MKSLRLAAVTGAALLALTACGSGSPTGGGTAQAPAGDGTAPAGDATAPAGNGAATADGELTAIEVGVIPIVDVASVYTGVEAGIFEEHGLDVTLTLAQGGAAIVPAVQSGQMDFGFSNVGSLVIGRDAGLPLKIVAPGPQSTGDPEGDAAAVMVPEDSQIQDVSDLQGQRVAVNTLNNIMDTTVAEGVRQAGGDPDAVEFTEMAFPDMIGQLQAGNVDAIAAVEPFVTMARNAGARPVYGHFAEPIEDLGIGAYFTTDQMIAENPELVESFTAAMKASQQYATENPEEAKEVLTTYTSIEEAVLDEMAMPLFPQEHNVASLERVARILQENGVIDEVPATEDLIIEAAGS